MPAAGPEALRDRCRFSSQTGEPAAFALRRRAFISWQRRVEPPEPAFAFRGGDGHPGPAARSSPRLGGGADLTSLGVAPCCTPPSHCFLLRFPVCNTSQSTRETKRGCEKQSGATCTPCAACWGGETPDRRPLLWLTKPELPGTASFTLVTPFLPLSFLKEQADDAKYDYSVEYQQPPDLTGKGLCARALYDYQAGKTCRALRLSELGRGLLGPVCSQRAGPETSPVRLGDPTAGC